MPSLCGRQGTLYNNLSPERGRKPRSSTPPCLVSTAPLLDFGTWQLPRKCSSVVQKAGRSGMGFWDLMNSSNNHRAQCRANQDCLELGSTTGPASMPCVFKACVLMSQPHGLLPPLAISAFYSTRRDIECKTAQETGCSPALSHVLCSLAHCLLAQHAILEG